MAAASLLAVVSVLQHQVLIPAVQELLRLRPRLRLQLRLAIGFAPGNTAVFKPRESNCYAIVHAELLMYSNKCNSLS